MSMDEYLQKAWQWLVPPVVDDAQGRLIARRRQGKPAKQNPAPTAAPVVTPAEAPAAISDGLQLGLEFDENDALVKELPGDGAINLRIGEPPEASWGKPGAGAVSSPVSSPVPTALSRHPQATHALQLQGQQVAYLLRRSARRSIGFSVSAKGLDVTAPRWVGMAEIEAALQTKSAWIVRKLQEAGQRQRLKEEARIDWCDGGQLDYLGHPLQLRLTGDASQPLRTRQTHREIHPDGQQFLHLPLPMQAAQAQVRAAVQAWMLREARSHFTARLIHFAPQMGVRWNALRLSSAQTRWGSATSAGVIRLNWRLMQHEAAVIDYVVVHELAHLHHMDHSPQFWAVVAQQIPHWKPLRKALQDKPLPAWE